jgi:YD repeat-containing protein
MGHPALIFAKWRLQSVSSLLLTLALCAMSAATPAVAQETFTYRIHKGDGWTPVATAASFQEAFQGIHSLLGNANARFKANETTNGSAGFLTTYTSTPFKYAFWNKSGFNGLAPSGPNAPGATAAEAIQNVIASQNESHAKDSGITTFGSLSVTGRFGPGDIFANWVLSASVSGVAVTPTVSYPFTDQMRGAVAYAEITRNIPPVCDCEKDYTVGNPINTATGAKVAIETDYQAPSGLLVFARAYNSQIPTFPNGMGHKGSWQHSFERRLFSGSPIQYSASSFRFDSALHPFSNNGYGANWVPAASNPMRLFYETDSAIGSTLRLFEPKDNSNEFYDAKGRLLAIKRADDQVLLSYSDVGATVLPATAPACSALAVAFEEGKLLCVTNRFGRQLNFAYDQAGSLRKMFDPAGGEYGYDYDNEGNLTQVTTPDGMRRAFTYNEPEYTSNTNLPNALTGIWVERSAGTLVRFATYRYDARGLAISTEHAGGVNAYTVSYDLANLRRTVTTPLGSTKTFLLGRKNYSYVLQSESRSGNGFATVANAREYDANGNVQTYTDLNGNVTSYTYDLARNLETKRIEGYGTLDARTITTEWHPTYRLPKRVAQPKRIVTNTYDNATGNLLSTSEQATTDLTGAQAFSATPTGPARLRSFEYNPAGQIRKVTGPRTDVVDVTAYDYDDAGNLSTVTNAAGHQTLLSNYDAHGRPRRVTDPNGLATDLVYTPRGLLSTSTTGSEVTSYTYDGTGQLDQVSRTGGVSITYAYDNAGRLNGIADNFGNTVTYTLDPMGNRMGEATRDPNGVLSRQISRIFDAMNRLKQVTGAQQ